MQGVAHGFGLLYPGCIVRFTGFNLTLDSRLPFNYNVSALAAAAHRRIVRVHLRSFRISQSIPQ